MAPCLMSPTAAPESTATDTMHRAPLPNVRGSRSTAAPESTATDTMLVAIKISAIDSAAVEAARTVRTRIAVKAAGRTVTSAASQNDDSSQHEDCVERSSPLAERQGRLARCREGLFGDEFMIVHTFCFFRVHWI